MASSKVRNTICGISCGFSPFGAVVFIHKQAGKMHFVLKSFEPSISKPDINALSDPKISSFNDSLMFLINVFYKLNACYKSAPL